MNWRMSCMVILALTGMINMNVVAAEPNVPLIVGHRGLLHHAPENTLAAFRACLELRLGFEFDVERTKDGHLVCLHDGTLDRTTTGKGRVADATLEQIRQLDAGRWFDPKFTGDKVPTIDEVLKLIAEYRQHNVLIAVDLKTDNVGPEIVAMAEKYDILDKLLFIGKTIVESKVRDQIRAASKKAHTGAVAHNGEELVKAMDEQNADWVYVRYIPTAEQMEQVKRRNKRAFIAGVTVGGNLPDNWTQVAKVGVDAILTDYPFELSATCRKLAH